jgi:hypothetical protein
MTGVAHGGLSRPGRYIAMDGLDIAQIDVAGFGSLHGNNRQ